MELEKVQVTLPTELLDFGRGLIDGQNFSCLDDVVLAALHHFRTVADNHRRTLEALKAEVQKGLDEIDRGEVFEEAMVFNELDEILGRKPEPAT